MEIEERGCSNGVECREHASIPNGCDDTAGVSHRVPDRSTGKDYAQGERPKRGLVRRDSADAGSRSVLAPPNPAVRVMASQANNSPARRQLIPSPECAGWPIQQGRQRRPRTHDVPQQRPTQPDSGFIAPLAVSVEPLEAVNRGSPIRPRKCCLQRIGMGSDTESAKALHVLDDGRGFPTEAIGHGREIEGDIVPAVRADLDAVDAQHAVDVSRRIGLSRSITMFSEHDEAQPGSTRGSGEAVFESAPSERELCT